MTKTIKLTPQEYMEAMEQSVAVLSTAMGLFSATIQSGMDGDFDPETIEDRYIESLFDLIENEYGLALSGNEMEHLYYHCDEMFGVIMNATLLEADEANDSPADIVPFPSREVH